MDLRIYTETLVKIVLRKIMGFKGKDSRLCKQTYSYQLWNHRQPF